MAWRIPKDFDGAAFRERYPQLGEWDFTVQNGMLVLRDGVTLPDDPPIMESATAGTQSLREKREAKKLLASKAPTSRATRAGLRAIRKVFRNKINEIIAAGKSGDWSNVNPLPNLTAEQESALFGSEVDSE